MKSTTTLEEAWDACLTLWKTLSELAPCNASVFHTDHETVNSTTFKNHCLKKLRYEPVMSGCPFCELYNTATDDNCTGCPIQEDIKSPKRSRACYDSPYGIWCDTFHQIGRHHPSKAKRFYNYLLKLKEDSDAKKQQQ